MNKRLWGAVAAFKFSYVIKEYLIIVALNFRFYSPVFLLRVSHFGNHGNYACLDFFPVKETTPTSSTW